MSDRDGLTEEEEARWDRAVKSGEALRTYERLVGIERRAASAGADPVWAEQVIARWSPDEQSRRVEQRARELAGSNHKHGAIPARFWHEAITEFATTSLLSMGEPRPETKE